MKKILGFYQFFFEHERQIKIRSLLRTDFLLLIHCLASIFTSAAAGHQASSGGQNQRQEKNKQSH